MHGVTSGHQHSTAWQLIWRPWPDAWVKSHWSNFGPTGPPPNSRRSIKKGAASGCERPKSREETPKEGSSSSRYRTAISYIATHKNQGSKAYSPCYFCIAAARPSSPPAYPCENTLGGTPQRSRNLLKFCRYPRWRFEFGVRLPTS